MKKQQAVQFLEHLGIKGSATKRTGWVVSECPLGPWRHEGGKSGSEVFGIKEETGDSFCHCFSCGWGGQQSELLTEIAYRDKGKPSGKTYNFKAAMQLIATAEEEFELDLDQPDVEELYLHGKGGLHVFDDWWVESYPLAKDVAFAVEFLKSRNVPENLWDTLELRADTNQKRVCFPVKDFNNRYVGLHGRAIHADTEPRYRMYTYKGKNNPICWLGENLVDLTIPVVFGEGPFDMASIMRVWPNTVSPLFSNPSVEKLKRMGEALEIVTFFDRGTGGDLGRAKVDKVFGSDHIVSHCTPPSHRKDAGEMTEDELVDILSEHVPLD